MGTLTAFYFSGTGNTRYITENLCKRLKGKYDITIFDLAENKDYAKAIAAADTILIGFPIYGSAPPLPVRRFVYRYEKLWKGKEFILAETQYLFSGDGAASLGRTIERMGGKVGFAEHFNMPNNLADMNLLKIRSGEEARRTAERADKRMDAFAEKISAGKPFRRGFGAIAHMVGYYGQRKWWRKSEPRKRGMIKIDADRCSGCGQCVRHCPVANLTAVNGKARAKGQCVFCYRCVNLCPQQAITLFGKAAPARQYKGLQS